MSKRLIKSIGTFSSLTLVSRILGFARDMVLAFIFGATGQLDAFFAAYKIPNFLRRLFAEGAFSQSFLPVAESYKEEATEEQTLKFFDNIAGTLLSALLILCVLVLLAAPYVTMIFTPGFYLHNPEKWALTTNLLRITFPYLLLISLTAFLSAILNMNRHFAGPAFAPVLLNLSFIFCAYFVASELTTPIYALAIAVPIGGALQLILQSLIVKKYQRLPHPKLNFRDPGVRRVLKLLLPAIFGVSVTQISLLADTMFASFLPSGSISWLYYSERLIHFPQGVFGIAIATVILPELAKSHVKKHSDRYKATLDWGIRNVLLIGIPASIGLCLLAGPALATLFLFKNGQFRAEDVEMARLSLMAYCVGLPAFMLIKILASAFYAQQNMKTPVKIAVIAVCTNLALNALLIRPLAHAGLALATSIAAWVNAGCLAYCLYRNNIWRPSKEWFYYSKQLLFTNFGMGGLIYFIVPTLPTWLTWNTSFKLIVLSGVILGAILVYGSGLWLSGYGKKDLKVQS